MNWVIVGGGFKGMLAATILLHQGQKVTLIEKGSALGGVMKGIQWRGFNLDLGCQIFDNSTCDITQYLFAMMKQQIRPVKVKYAGLTAGCWSENYTVPDLTHSCSEKSLILSELAKIQQQSEARINITLSDYLVNRFGDYAGEKLIEAAAKKLQFSPDELDACAANMLFFDRVKLLNETTSLELKKQAFYDERLAVYSDINSMQFYPDAEKFYSHRNFYPEHGGMHQFCMNATDHLKACGANIICEQSIKAIGEKEVVLENGSVIEMDKLIWAAELDILQSILFNENTLKKFIHPVPMVVIYFEVDIDKVGPYTYVHDHTVEHLIFRGSTTGIYSNQIIDGKTYICCEVPTHLNSAIWLDAKNYVNTVWQEACNLQLCTGPLPENYKLLQAPVTFKLPKCGYQVESQKIQNAITTSHPELIWIDPVHTALVDIADNLIKEIQKQH